MEPVSPSLWAVLIAAAHIEQRDKHGTSRSPIRAWPPVRDDVIGCSFDETSYTGREGNLTERNQGIVLITRETGAIRLLHTPPGYLVGRLPPDGLTPQISWSGREPAEQSKRNRFSEKTWRDPWIKGLALIATFIGFLGIFASRCRFEVPLCLPRVRAKSHSSRTTFALSSVREKVA